MPVCWALLAGPRPGTSVLRMNTKAVPVVVAGIAVITGLVLTLLLAGGPGTLVAAGLGLFVFVAVAAAVALEH
jgi:hypothetical protein